MITPCRFPLELEAFRPEDLTAHLNKAHKHCAFCNEYYYGEPATNQSDVGEHTVQHQQA